MIQNGPNGRKCSKIVKNGRPDLKRAQRTGLSARKARRTKSRGPKGLQLEVGARRAPRLLVYDICTLNNFRSNIDGVYHITDWFLKTFVQIHLPWNKVRMLSDFIIFSLWAASPRWSPCIIFTLMHIAQVPENQLQLLRPYQARVQKSLEKLDVPGLSINLIILIILIIMIIILLIMFTLIIINESVNIIGLKPCLSITNQHYIVSSSTNSF